MPPAMSSLPALPESDDNLAIFGARSRVGKAEEDGVAESPVRAGFNCMWRLVNLSVIHLNSGTYILYKNFQLF